MPVNVSLLTDGTTLKTCDLSTLASPSNRGWIPKAPGRAGQDLPLGRQLGIAILEARVAPQKDANLESRIVQI